MERLPDLQELRNLGIPVVEIDLQSADDFAAEIFKWEIATALACVPMGVNCFQAEDGQSNLERMGAKVGTILAKGVSSAPRERIKEQSLTLFVEGQTRRLISGLSMRSALQTFLELRDAGGYIAICPFFELTPAYIATLDALARSYESSRLECRCKSRPGLVICMLSARFMSTAQQMEFLLSLRRRPAKTSPFQELVIALANY